MLCQLSLSGASRPAARNRAALPLQGRRPRPKRERERPASVPRAFRVEAPRARARHAAGSTPGT